MLLLEAFTKPNQTNSMLPLAGLQGGDGRAGKKLTSSGTGPSSLQVGPGPLLRADQEQRLAFLRKDMWV